MPGAWISRRRVDGRAERALAVDRLAERVHDAARAGASPTGTERIRPVARTTWPSSRPSIVAEHDGADRLLVEVEGEADGAVLELEQLVDRRAGQPGDAGDAVADLGDAADLLGFRRGGEVADVARERGGDVVGVDRELRHRWGSFVFFVWSGTVVGSDQLGACHSRSRGRGFRGAGRAGVVRSRR